MLFTSVQLAKRKLIHVFLYLHERKEINCLEKNLVTRNTNKDSVEIKELHLPVFFNETLLTIQLAS